MAGEQSKAMSVGSYCARKNVTIDGLTHYPVPDHNKPVSTHHFNVVKQYLETTMPQFVEHAVKKFGEKEWWKIVREEMDKYAFGFEGNQALYLYAKYKNEVKA